MLFQVEKGLAHEQKSRVFDNVYCRISPFFPFSVAVGTIEVFGSLYFAATDDKSIANVKAYKLSALRYLMCVTPLSISDYQNRKAREILRVVLLDAMGISDDTIRFAADKVCERYALHDKTGCLKDLLTYRLTTKDHTLIEQLKKSGKKRFRVSCVSES